jgi:hypothetical protein
MTEQKEADKKRHEEQVSNLLKALKGLSDTSRKQEQTINQQR